MLGDFAVQGITSGLWLSSEAAAESGRRSASVGSRMLVREGGCMVAVVVRPGRYSRKAPWRKVKERTFV